MSVKSPSESTRLRRRYILLTLLSLPMMVVAGTLIVFWTRGDLGPVLKVLAVLFVAGWIAFEIWLATLSTRIRRMAEAEESAR